MTRSAIAGLADAAGQQHRDVAGVLVGRRVAGRFARLTAQDAQRFELREPVDRFLPQALAEVVEVVRRAVIRERQHRDRVLSGERRRRSNGVRTDVASRLLKTGA